MDELDLERCARVLVRRFVADSGLRDSVNQYAEDEAVAYLLAQPLFVTALVLRAAEMAEADDS